MSGPLNGKTWPVFAALGGLVVAAVLWVSLDQSPTLTFGSASASYLKSFVDLSAGPPTAVPTIAPGEKFRICLDGVVWYRLSPSISHMWFFDTNGRRYDLPIDTPLGTRPIPLPPSVGSVGPKCRTEVMPDVGMPPGPSILTGVFISTDAFLWRTRIVTLSYPRMPFIAKAAP